MTDKKSPREDNSRAETELWKDSLERLRKAGPVAVSPDLLRDLTLWHDNRSDSSRG